VALRAARVSGKHEPQHAARQERQRHWHDARC
jgi:hypothetical protein